MKTIAAILLGTLFATSCTIDTTGLPNPDEPLAQMVQEEVRLVRVIRCQATVYEPYNVLTYELYEFSSEFVWVSGMVTNYQGWDFNSNFYDKAIFDSGAPTPVTLNIENSSDGLVWKLYLETDLTGLRIETQAFTAGSSDCHATAN